MLGKHIRGDPTSSLIVPIRIKLPVVIRMRTFVVLANPTRAVLVVRYVGEGKAFVVGMALRHLIGLPRPSPY